MQNSSSHSSFTPRRLIGPLRAQIPPPEREPAKVFCLRESSWPPMRPAQAREHEISGLTGDNTLTYRHVQTSDSAHFLFPVRHGLPEKANRKIRLVNGAHSSLT